MLYSLIIWDNQTWIIRGTDQEPSMYTTAWMTHSILNSIFVGFCRCQAFHRSVDQRTQGHWVRDRREEHVRVLGLGRRSLLTMVRFLWIILGVIGINFGKVYLLARPYSRWVGSAVFLYQKAEFLETNSLKSPSSPPLLGIDEKRFFYICMKLAKMKF